jgi:hypothetical protein
MPLLYAGRNALARKATTAVTGIAVAVSVMVFLILTATAEGIAKIATATGTRANLLVLSAGAASAELSYLDRSALNRARELTGVARDSRGYAIASVELVVPRSIRRSTPDGSTDARYVTLRGVTPAAFRVHAGVGLAAGAYPRAANEILVGDVLARIL